MEKHRLYKPNEIAELLGVSLSCIYRKAENGEMPCIKIGSALRFSEDNINEYLEKCRRNNSNDNE
jgi:excisionase family DNA binding protein